MLAYHYSKSENHEKAYKYLKLSGNKASKNYSNWEAFRFCGEAINVLTKIPETEENKREQIEVRLLMAAPMYFLGFPEDSLEILQNGEELSRELGDEKSIAHFLSLMGQYYAWKGEDLHLAHLGIQYSEAAFKEAEKIGDIELMAPIGMDLCRVHFFRGEVSKIIDVASMIIALLDKTQRQTEFFGRAFNAYSALHSEYAFSMGMLGNFEEGRVLFEKGLDFALKIKDLFALSLLEMHYGTVLTSKGDGKDAIEHIQNSMSYDDEGQMVFRSGVAWMHLGWAYCLLGKLKTAQEYMEKGLKIHIDRGALFHTRSFYWSLSMVHLELGDLKKARYNAEEALKSSQKSLDRWHEGLAWILLGRIHGKAEKPQDSNGEECILRGIRILDDLKLKPLYAQGHHFLGELYANKGQQNKAINNLKKAEGMFQEMGMDHWLAKTDEVLKGL